MWSALDWTGMLITPETPPASAPTDSPTATARPVAANRRRPSSSRTVHAEAIEVVAEPTNDKKLCDTDSDTGGETDSDADNEVVAPRHDGTRRRTCLVLFFCLLVAVLAASGAFAKKAEEEDTVKSLEGVVSRNFSCFANSTVDFETADVILNFDGMEREATEAELQEVQETIAAVYNNVSAGCDDLYQRFMAGATIVEQSVVEDSKGGKHLTMGIETSVACDGCGVEDEILFGGDEEEDSSDDGKKDENKDERKLRSGIRGIRGSISTGSARRVLKVKKGSKKSPNSQEFIDELDANLQASGLPLKEVKEGFVYKQKGGKKGKDKVKLVPKKNKKEEKDEDEIYKGHLKEDSERRQRRY